MRSERRPDRRVGRTRRLLKTALLELIQERRYEEITIGEISERADVGRSTFYSHFRSKDDLLLDGFDRSLMGFAAETPSTGSGGGFRFSRPLLEHVRVQRKLFLATIIRASDAQLRGKVLDLFARVIQAELAARAADTSTGGHAPAEPADRAFEARSHAAAGAFLGLAAWWLERAPELSAEAVDRIFNDAVSSEVRLPSPEAARAVPG